MRTSRGTDRTGHDRCPASSPFQTLTLTHSSTVDRVADELRRAVFDGELEAGTPLREVALADSLGVARSTVREALGVLVAEGIATREPNRGVSVSSPDPDSISDVVPRPRRCSRSPGSAHWPTGQRGGRGARSARPSTPTPRRSRPGASYQQLNERHLALHLVAGRRSPAPRGWSRMAESLIAELKVALAQIDRIRRNAHDQAGSHTHLLTAARGAATSRPPPPSSRTTSPAPRSRSAQALDHDGATHGARPAGTGH